MTDERFPIPSRGPYRALAVALGARSASLTVGGDRIVVSYGPWFRADVPRSAVVSVEIHERRTISRGVHGWRGAWLVNGAGSGLVRIVFDPEQRARMTGVRVRLRELVINVDDPAALVAALRV